MSWVDDANRTIQNLVDRLGAKRVWLGLGVVAIMIALAIFIYRRGQERALPTTAGTSGSDTQMLPLPTSRWESTVSDYPADATLETTTGPTDTDTSDGWVRYSAPSDGLAMDLPGTPQREYVSMDFGGETWTHDAVVFYTQDTNGDMYMVMYQTLTTAAPDSGASDFFDLSQDELDPGQTATRFQVGGHQGLQIDSVDPDTGAYSRARTLVMPDRVVTVTGVSQAGAPPVNYDYVFNSLQIEE